MIRNPFRNRYRLLQGLAASFVGWLAVLIAALIFDGEALDHRNEIITFFFFVLVIEAIWLKTWLMLARMRRRTGLGMSLAAFNASFLIGYIVAGILRAIWPGTFGRANYVLNWSLMALIAAAAIWAIVELARTEEPIERIEQ